MKEKVSGFISKIQNARYFVKLIIFASICVICGIISVLSTGVTIGYEVCYNGEVVAVVSSRADFDSAREIASLKIANGNSSKYIEKVEFNTVVTLKNRLDTPNVLCDELIKRTETLTDGAALNINGHNVAFAKTKEEMEAFINKRLSYYDKANAENKAEFVDDVKILDVYCADNVYSSAEQITNCLAALSVKTTAKYREGVVVKYDTVTRKNNQKLIGYREVAVEGVNGLNHTVEQVVYIDGVEYERKELEPEVVAVPVDKVVVVGTAYTSEDGNATTNMVFPIARTSYFVSSPFREDRGYYSHKGTDIATNKGTPIYAVQEGTVLTAGWHDDYGYHVIINHGNGVQTLYAHASRLLVTAGSEVTRGQKIAEVGDTGWATGYHLHIELTIDGKYVDPLKYIQE